VKLNYSFNFILLALSMMVLCALQTSFWFQLFGSVPAPLLWINLLIYIALYRKPALAICVIYALGYVAISFTLMPLKMMFVNLAILFTLVYLIKSRFFWAGSGYYTIMCLFGGPHRADHSHSVFCFSNVLDLGSHGSLDPLRNVTGIRRG
jgi:hypothetical protein